MVASERVGRVVMTEGTKKDPVNLDTVNFLPLFF